jgi:predicted  nucleic acid-binding Zn-ribbon protein
MNPDHKASLTAQLSDLAHRVSGLEQLLQLQAPTDTKSRADLKAEILKLLQQQRSLQRELKESSFSGQT